MQGQKESFPGAILDRFNSARVVLALFLLLICLLIPSTFFPEFLTALLWPAKAVLCLLGLSLAACTLRKLKTLRKSTLVIHLGTMVILAGGLISTFGFVATVNVYEGASTDMVFNWRLEKDVSLGFDLRVRRIHMSFYPVDVKVGVLKNGQKAELFVSRTEDSFVFEGYRIHVQTLDPAAKTLNLEIFEPDGGRVGTMTTSGRKDLPVDFPLDFQLVAFKDPVLRRVWVDLELLKAGEVMAAGTSEVNRPLRWQSAKFFLTQVDADSSGRRYAGIQISKDPGAPIVYGGFILLGLGLLLALKRWVGNSRRKSS